MDDSLDPEEPLGRLLRGLRTSKHGLSSRDAADRLLIYGPNQLERRNRRPAWRELLRQLTHPLALLLWAAAGLAWLGRLPQVGIAIVVVILLNAAFAYAQELQAEHAVEALAAYLPQSANVLRDRKPLHIPAAEIVPGDVLVIGEGERVPADGRLMTGSLELDTSSLTGESVPVSRAAEWQDTGVPLLEARDLVFSGSVCTTGQATVVVTATGMHTELGRIAALSQRTKVEASPLERQVRRVAWLIALIAVVMAAAFLPIATLGGGVTLTTAMVMAVGLIAGNVPEGLLPVITLALAIGVRDLAGRGAVVKRLSAVETLGSTDVICTDKTGTLTENHMQVMNLWSDAGEVLLSAPDAPARAPHLLLNTMIRCNNARLGTDGSGDCAGDPTELALLEAAEALGVPSATEERERSRLGEFSFDPVVKLMTTIDAQPDGSWINTKGAPEAVLPHCDQIYDAGAHPVALDDRMRDKVFRMVDEYASRGLRVLAFAVRPIDSADGPPASREDAERHLRLVGLTCMLDPPRPEVAEAVSACHSAGIRVIVVTGDHPLTAAAIARSVGIGDDTTPLITGQELARMSDPDLDALLRGRHELIFARTSPEAKLRIADALRAEGHIVAMTGDGVNDAPALRRADIGVAMGRVGTEVAREASTMVLTDDNFATIVTAVQAGRRVYDNIRKFIVYIFAHATPEIVPYLVFALARGLVPLPLTVLQLLAFDVGTETLPALALGREPAEPGIMSRPPRHRGESVIRAPMLLRAWLFLGVIAATLQMGAFFYVLLSAGWRPGDPVGSGSPLHHAYVEATTMTFLSMIMAQIGTAFAARTERASLRSVGFTSNRLLLWGIVFELGLAALLIYAPPLQHLLTTTALPPHLVALTLAFPPIVWGADEVRRWLVRRATP